MTARLFAQAKFNTFLLLFKTGMLLIVPAHTIFRGDELWQITIITISGMKILTIRKNVATVYSMLFWLFRF
jgi:hypothetical protein